MSRTPSIRLTKAAESELAAVVQLLGRGQPIPPSRGGVLRYALTLPHWYLAYRAHQGDSSPTLNELEEVVTRPLGLADSLNSSCAATVSHAN